VLHLELLNAPDLEANVLASSSPCILSTGGGLTDLLIEVRTETSDVGVSGVVLFGLNILI